MIKQTDMRITITVQSIISHLQEEMVTYQTTQLEEY